MKLSNNALNFLLAQYRAIFKRAYVQAANVDDSFWYTENDTDWSEQPTPIQGGSTSHKRFAGGYDDGNKAGHNTGVVSGESLVLGSSTNGGDIETIDSGSAYGGYVMITSDASGAALNAEASNNKLTVTSGGNITGNGNLVGGWAKTQGTGTALASGNTLTIEKVESLSAGGQFIGGMAGGYHGAEAEGNQLKITGLNNTDKILNLANSIGNIGAIVYVGDGDAGAVAGTYKAEGNTVEASNFIASGTTTDSRSFVGGYVTVSDLETDHTIDRLSSIGNSVTLSDFTLGSESQTAVGHIVGNKVVFGTGVTGTVQNIEANGTADTGIKLTDGKIYASQVYGGWAESQSGGSASANANNITITDTDLLASSNDSGSNVIGGLAQTDIATKSQIVTLTASDNTVNFENTATGDKVAAKSAVGNIYGAMVTLSGSSVNNALGSTLTTDNNKVVVGDNVAVSSGSIHGAYIQITGLASGGATVHASNNTVTLDGDFTASDAAHTIIAVQTESGLVTAEGNSVVINGKVTGSNGTQIMAVNVSQQQAIGTDLTADKIVHKLSNNSVTIGAGAEVIDTTIAAAISNANNAHTLNNDVTIEGKVSNSSIYGGTGADSVVDVKAGARLDFTAGTSSAPQDDNSINSDVVNLAGIVNVGQHDIVTVRGFFTDGNNTNNKFNTNQTTIADTAQLYNRGKINLLGQTTVETGAQLHALRDGATISVNGDQGGNTIEDDADNTTLKNAMVGGRGQLTIAAAQLKSYLTSDTDKAGTVEVTSGGVLEFSDDSIDLATLDYVKSSASDADKVGKIVVDETGGTSILKGDAVTISHALASNGSTANTLDFSKETDYEKLAQLDAATSGVTIEANQLFLGSSRIDADQSAHIKFNKASAKDRIDFTVGSGTFQLASEVAGNNFMRTDDQDSDLDFFTALNGTITGNVDVVSGGKLAIEYGHWTAKDDITLKADASTGGGELVVGIDNVDDKRNTIAYDNGTLVPYGDLPDATLVLDQALTVNLSGAGTAKVTVDGQNSSGYTYADGEHNRLYLYDEELAQSTVGDDHYVMLDLRNGLNMVGDEGTLKGRFDLIAKDGGVVKVMADDINSLLTQNDAANAASGAFIEVSGKAHLQVTGDVSADFGDFGDGTNNGIKLGDNGVMSANSLSLINADTGTLQEDATYITNNKINFGSETGTVAVSEVTINDLQRVTKPDDTKSDNDYASQVTFAQGTLDIGSNLSSINDTLVVGDATGNTKAHLDFYGADIDESTSGATTVGTINVDTVSVQNGSLDVLNGAWEGNAFVLGASGAMTVGSSEEDTRADLSAQKLTMTQGSSLSVLAKGSMTVNEVDFSGLSAAATRVGEPSATANTGVLVDGTLVINGSSAEHGGVTFGAAGSIDIANNGILKFGTAATNGAILDTSSTKSFSGSGSINLVQGYTQIDNNGGELHLALGSDVVFDGDAIKALKDALFTDGSFESGVQLASGGILNIGDASFKGITGFESLTAPGTSGYTIAWNNVKDFSDIYGNDVTNNQLSQVNVNSIQQGTKVQGNWGSLTMEDGVAAGAQVTIFGNTWLRNAAGNNGFFVSDANRRRYHWPCHLS